MRLNAQVVQADPENTLWSESFERAATDVLALQNTFASAIASAIHVQVSPVEQTRLATTKAVDPEVYEAFLQGKYYGGQFGEASVRKAKGYFERAIAKDPTFAPAWSGLSESLQWLAAFHADPAQLMPEAEAAARRAIELDGSLAEAHSSLSGIFLNRWNFAAAEVEIRKAIELNPGSAAAHRGHWLLLAYQLRLAEASTEIEIAKRLDPLSAQVSADAGVQHLFEGRYEAAIAELKNALELDPDYALSHVYLFLTYSEMKKDPERGLELRHYVSDLGRPELVPQFNHKLEAEGYDRALSWIANELDAHPPAGDATRFGVIGGLLAQAGEREKALTWLERGVDQHAWDMASLAVAPDYRNLRGEPRFSALLKKVGLPAPSPTAN